MDLGLKVDAVFSVGLIEHFDRSGTREAVLAHLRLLDDGGVAIISYPTPTLLYRAARSVTEVWACGIFRTKGRSNAARLSSHWPAAAGCLREDALAPGVHAASDGDSEDRR